MRGGYKIIDLKGTVFTSGEPATVAGTFGAIQNSFNKATLISGLVVGDVEYPDFFAPFVPASGDFTADVVIGSASISITVTSADAVTVTVV